MDSKGEKDVIYLDYNATTNIHEEVRKEMEPYLNIYFGKN
jgi:cysteine sulfinate desulfinase/cysteine desulfurase-like protein